MSSFDTKQPLRIREKLMTQGTKNLSDPELLAAFISSGNAKKSCLQLAFDLLHQFGDLRAILQAEPSRFQKIAGMGLVRYVQLQAAREMCQRADYITLQKEFQLHNFEQTYAYLKRQLRDQKNVKPLRLYFWIINIVFWPMKSYFPAPSIGRAFTQDR